MVQLLSLGDFTHMYINIALIMYGNGNNGWYDIIFIGIGVIMFFPDLILEWIGEGTGRLFSWRHIVWLEIIAIVSIVIGMMLLMPSYPMLTWWNPIAFIGGIAILRTIKWLVDDMVEPND
jgi:hypothetical protein